MMTLGKILWLRRQSNGGVYRDVDGILNDGCDDAGEYDNNDD